MTRIPKYPRAPGLTTGRSRSRGLGGVLAGAPGGAQRSLTLLFSPVQCTIAWLCVASPLSTNDVLMSETCAGEAAPVTGAARAQRPWPAAGAPSSPGPRAGPRAPDSAPRACHSSPSPGSARPAGRLRGDRVSQARGPRRPGSGERPAAPPAASSRSGSRSGRKRGEGGGGGGAPGLRAGVAGLGPFGARGGPRCAMVAEGRRQGGAGEGDHGRESGRELGSASESAEKGAGEGREPAGGGDSPLRRRHRAAEDAPPPAGRPRARPSKRQTLRP